MLSFTQKEKTLLEDQKKHEQICIEKYSNYANMVSDQQLKNIFKQNAQNEQEHLNTINQLLNGQMPNMSQYQNSQQSQQQSQQQQQYQSQSQQMQMSSSFNPQNKTSNYNGCEKDLCTDMLMTEKYVSGTYDTAIFEFKDPQVRDLLNHIQKEEQQHGESVFKYMEKNGMYSAK